MRHNKSILLTLGTFLLLAGSLVGCKKENPFSGDDNFIFAFDLISKEGTTYKGKIGHNGVLIQVPSNLPLTSLQAKYTISEMATITPKPEEVTTWSKEQSFTVTSYSGVEREYTVTLQFTDVVAGNVISLSTDEEVEQFAKQGVNIIGGSLILGKKGSGDTIRNIEALSKIREVRYDLIIHGNVVADLTPLSGLVRIGSLQMTEKNKSYTALSFPNLKSLPNGLNILSDSIRSISLPMVEEIGKITFEGKKLTTLELPKVRVIHDDIALKAPALATIAMPELTGVQNISIVRAEYNKALSLTTLSMPKLTRVQSIKIEESKNLETFSLPALREANSIDLAYVTAVKTFDLSSLERIETLELSADYGKQFVNNIITELELPKLAEVGKLTIEFNAFSNLKALRMPELQKANSIKLTSKPTTYEAPKLKSIEKLYIASFTPGMTKHLKTIKDLEFDLTEGKTKDIEVDISGIEDLKNVTFNIKELSKIVFPKKVEGKVILSYNSRSAKVAPVMEGLEECGSFRVEYPSDVTEVELPGTLTKVTNEVYISNSIEKVVAKGLIEVGGSLDLNTSSTSFLDTPKLHTVGGNLDLRSPNFTDANLQSLYQVDKLIIGSKGSYRPNNALTNLNFITSLVKLNKIEVKYCYKLSDYSGLKKLVKSGQINENNWNSTTVNYNYWSPTILQLRAGKFKP